MTRNWQLLSSSNWLRPSRLGLLTVLALGWAGAQVHTSPEAVAPSRGVLELEPTSTPVPGGKASLTISVLTRQAETYIGEYQFTVSPYFFKSEKGKLSIDVPDDTLKKLDNGMTVEFTGLATNTGNGKTRRINGKATPLDQKQGTVNLRFLAEKREMQFNTSYRFNPPTKPRS